MSGPVDFVGREIRVGDEVVKISVSSSRPRLTIKTVSAIDGHRVYLNGWHSPVDYNNRLIVVVKP